ncbi:hypothetical protein DMC30DRAFT_396223 [Rhodotorula diobovata]|uniref:Major facilitator superfamily (MFS) profile domain-containing protein n=1 Tax=Rhodotorula diobovata TaxID=5288 RepID=A0A5C5FZ42_9BASI|nr:hypothetical protein DMC30DRAFT_396223 [Rhodotorula diobovata]
MLPRLPGDTALTPAGAFALFSLVAVAGWLFTYFLLPETKGLSLEQVRALFEQQVGLAPQGAAGDALQQDARQQGGYHVVGDEESEADDEASGLMAAARERAEREEDDAGAGREDGSKGGRRRDVDVDNKEQGVV